MSPEQLAKYERLKKQLQDAILRDYPNPKRIGCPDHAVLVGLAERPLTSTIDDEDPHWKHITHCSECYREFLDLNTAYRQRTKRQFSPAWPISVISVLVIFSVVIYVRHDNPTPGRQNAEIGSTNQTVDLPSVTRSEDSPDQRPVVLERSVKTLTVRLPIGSRPGAYEFQLKKQDRAVLVSTENAELRNGVTFFTVKLDRSRVFPGTYSMVIKRDPFDWQYTVILR